MYKTPRTDEADKFVTYANKLDGKAYATEWVYASFAQDLEIELNELKKWKEEALKVMNQWNEVSDYINLNAEVEDIGRFVPQICLKYLKERDEMILLEESVKVLTDERNRWHELFEEGVKQQREVEEQRDDLKNRVKMLEDIIAKHTSIPKAVIPMLTTKFPEIVQSEITPVPKEEA